MRSLVPSHLFASIALAVPTIAGCSQELTSGRDAPLQHTRAALTPMDDVLGWLVQDACDEDPTQDPVSCPQARHDLRPGERIFYDRQAFIQNDGFSRGTYSFPSLNDREVVINARDRPPYHHWNTADDPRQDGYEVLEASYPYVSLIDERDQTAVTWARPASTYIGAYEINDAWILFRHDALAGGSATSQARWYPWEQNGQARGAMSSAGSASFDARWERSFLDYGSGKVLETIKTVSDQVFASGTVKQQVRYFTREYGLTRTETWAPMTVEPNTVYIFPTNCTFGEADRYDAQGRHWFRDSCVQWHVTTPNPEGFDPAVWPTPQPRVPALEWNAATEMSHATGHEEDGDWTARTWSDAPGHLLYGPYTTELAPNTSYTAAFTTKTDGSGQGTLFIADVFDATNQVSRGQRSVNGGDPLANNDWTETPVNFTTPSNPGAHELRIWWTKNVGLATRRVRVSENRTTWPIKAEAIAIDASDPTVSHGVGVQGYAPWGQWWWARRADFGAGYLAWTEPRALVHGARAATWTVELTGRNAGMTPSTALARLEVIDASTYQTVGLRTLTSGEMPNGGARSISVPFVARGTSRYLSRVYWYDNTDMWLQDVRFE